MTIPESDYIDYLHGELLHDRYLRVKSLNEGSFGIVSIAKDTQNNDKFVAVKYNTGRLSDFEAYQKNQSENNLINEVRSVSLNSKTRSVIKSDGNYSNTTNTNGKDISKSIVLRETKQEILMIQKVDSHPNIITLLDHFDTYMIFEYAPRGDLHDAIQLGIAPVATSDVIDVFMQLISAVEFCHKNGVYHRDIKPENILISDDWSIKLTDFGLATEHLICTDFDVGSERYMAPELLEHSDIDSYAADKVDIWSLGICLLNIVFGKSPFRSASSKDKMFLHFAANRETLFDIFPFMSYDLFSVMIHSLTIDPANRDLEMIKENLLNIDVLTYDYEFEEDDIDNNKSSALVEELEEDEENNVPTHNINKLDDQNIMIQNENTEPITTTDKVPTIISKENESLTKSSQKSVSLLKPPVITTTSCDKMDSIDNLLENNLDNDSTIKNENHTASKPIAIKLKKYEPPHKFLINSLQENRKVPSNNKKSYNYNNNNNNNNNNNYRAKRWIPAHRKPLKIANYNSRNRSQDGIKTRGRDSFKDDTFDFNRKDYFTPRSVFTSYMEKANRGKQQLQQRSTYYKKHKDFESNSNNNYNYNYKHAFNNNNNNNSNNYYNYEDRRAWQKRKRRPSYAQGNNNNSNKNKGSYRSNNIKSRNSRLEGLNWNSNSSDRKLQTSRRLSTTSINNGSNSYFTHIPTSLRASMDGKYIPPNLRLNASQLMGSAVVSDEETDLDNDNFSNRGKRYVNGSNTFESPKEIDEEDDDDNSNNNNNNNNDDDDDEDSEEDTFSFELDQPTLPEVKQNTSYISPSTNNDGNNFQQIQSNVINILSKQFTESRLFDDKGSSRDTSLTTTISNNFSSTGSNIIGGSPKGYKKYIPPHHRRSSHSAADTEIKISKPIANIILNHYTENNKDRSMSPVSTSAPTKSSSFFNSNFNKVMIHDENLTDNGFNDFGTSDQYDDDLFNIEEGRITSQKGIY
ncbi:hypothetical protein C6P40_001796 [Pichia californica]|uniref:Protein kinase domain-containing protein n=1 Tax=Pichia californica TaxID=460514 RepID=A0A9P7BFL7_9ASCO|nr:hypothetical protein C6P42_002211 [[Candida] californica]KAG0690707.1 hypothetical protein C6P40_001796 [[Candida] californica]